MRDGRGPLVLGAAVTARAIELSEGLRAVAVDLDMTGTVMLDNLVRGSLGATTNNVGGAASLLDRDGVLADVLEPDVVEVAWTEAVYAFLLILADDYIPEKNCVKPLRMGKLSVLSHWTVPPDATRKTASASPPSPDSQAPEPRSKRTFPPSKVPVTEIGAESDELFGGLEYADVRNASSSSSGITHVGKVHDAARFSKAGASSSMRT